MKKVYDIKNIAKNKNISDLQYTYQYHGKMILDDTGWFEGYLKLAYTDHSEFIFGIYHPNQVLDLYVCNYWDGRPAIFKGNLENSEFVGTFSYFYSEDEIKYFDHFAIVESETNSDKLEGKLELFKNKTFNSKTREFYNKVYENRIDLSDILLKKSQGVEFTLEDKMAARHIKKEQIEARQKYKVKKKEQK